MTDTYKHGWLTMPDGSRIPLTEDEAKDLHAQVKALVAERAAKLPTTVAALQAISEATERLRELGWTTISPKEGETVACIQLKSTGMWEAWRGGEFVHYEDCVSRPSDRIMMFKPLDKLTDDERERMAYCVANRPRYL